MRVELDLPDWAEGPTLHIMAGIEEIARKEPSKSWEVKVNRCIKCGKCCKDCKHLIYRANEYLCDLKSKRPFSCCVGDGWTGECKITWQSLD